LLPASSLYVFHLSGHDHIIFQRKCLKFATRRLNFLCCLTRDIKILEFYTFFGYVVRYIQRKYMIQKASHKSVCFKIWLLIDSAVIMSLFGSTGASHQMFLRVGSVIQIEEKPS
jgi:hypothetical protein